MDQRGYIGIRLSATAHRALRILAARHGLTLIRCVEILARDGELIMAQAESEISK